jgi:hypothetical protein
LFTVSTISAGFFKLYRFVLNFYNHHYRIHLLHVGVVLWRSVIEWIGVGHSA